MTTPRLVIRTVVAVLLIATIATVGATPAGSAPRPIGDIQVFTTLPYPGTPGGVAVDGHTLYVDTSAANFDRPFDGSDFIYAFNTDSERQKGAPIEVQRQYPVAPMGLAGMALDASGRLYAAHM